MKTLLKVNYLIDTINEERSKLDKNSYKYIRLGQILESNVKDRSKYKKHFRNMLWDEFPELLL